MSKNKKNQVSHLKSIKVISLLLSIVVAASTAALLLYKLASDRAYYEKWKDYDDCGLG